MKETSKTRTPRAPRAGDTRESRVENEHRHPKVRIRYQGQERVAAHLNPANLYRFTVEFDAPVPGLSSNVLNTTIYVLPEETGLRDVYEELLRGLLYHKLKVANAMGQGFSDLQIVTVHPADFPFMKRVPFSDEWLPL